MSHGQRAHSLQQPYFKLLFVALLLNLSGVICTNLAVSVTAIGPSQVDLDDAVTEALSSCQARDLLNGTSHRVLFSDFGDKLGDSKSSADLFQATVYEGHSWQEYPLIRHPFRYHDSNVHRDQRTAGSQQ